MRASELKAKLEHDQQELAHALGRLRAERASLALPAASGEEPAALRLVDVRAEIATREGEQGDLNRALSDIEPAVRQQLAAEVLVHRRAMQTLYEAQIATAGQKVAVVDALIDQLAAATVDAAQHLEAARSLVVELLVPPGADATHVASNRMIAYDSVGFRPLPREVLGTLKTLLDRAPGEFQSALAGQVADTRRSCDQRIQDAMRQSEREALAAGVEFAEPETEAA